MKVSGRTIITISFICASLIIVSFIMFGQDWGTIKNASIAFPPPAELMVSNFQPGHGFVKLTKTGLQLDDSNDFILGKQSLRLVTAGDASPLFTTESNLSQSIDFNDKVLKLWIKVNDTSRMGELRVTITGDDFQSYTNYWIQGGEKNVNGKFLRNNEWDVITISPTQTTSFGSPDLSKINTVQIRVVDRGTGSVSVSFNSLSLIPKNDRGIVTFTFDDGYESTYTTARQKLDEYHFPATAYVVTGIIGTSGRMTLEELKYLQDSDGWDVSPHTVDHLDLTTLNSNEIEMQLASSRQFLLDHGLNKGADHFAYPYGSFDTDIIKQMIQKYYKTARTTKGVTETLPPADPYRLRVMIITNTTTTSYILARVRDAVANGDWLILVFHEIVNSDADAEIKYLNSNFATVVDDIRSQGVEVMTVSEVYDAQFR